MEISLAGRAAVVTGGSKGVGLAVAIRFVASARMSRSWRAGRGPRCGAQDDRGGGARKVIAAQVMFQAGRHPAHLRRGDGRLRKIDIVVNNAASRAVRRSRKLPRRCGRSTSSKNCLRIRLTRLVCRR